MLITSIALTVLCSAIAAVWITRHFMISHENRNGFVLTESYGSTVSPPPSGQGRAEAGPSLCVVVAAKDEDSSVVGKKTKVKVVKNKVAPPLKVATFDIMYGEGISRLGELVELGTQLEIIQKSGSWYSYKDSRLGQGGDNVKKLLGDNPELADEIEGLIRAKLGLKPV